MKLPFDPQFPRLSEDQPLLHELQETRVRPVFIMGLHRSGTTFLYDCIARCFPVAQLSLYHLFYYGRLLTNHRDDNEQHDKDRLNRCFQALGITDRKIDRVPVNADEVEEYGFLLRQHSGSFKVGDQNATLFAELCQKLLAVQPSSQAVLLKNPWDTGNAAKILQLFPDARFVYISREPIDVLNSMLNASLAYLDGPQHYLELLLSRGQSRKGYRAGYAAWWLLRQARLLLGEGVISRGLRPLIARDVAKQVVNYRNEVASLPPSNAIELDYQRLVDNPAEVIRKLADFLDLPFELPVEGFEVRTRKNSNPALAHYLPTLERLISKADGQS